jgi:hypothetical protein
MLVAMPTAMPPGAIDEEVGKAGRQDYGSCSESS